jgi:UDP-N-acetyl-2-amino-2-deoxyglucuronate dehydrogenase
VTWYRPPEYYRDSSWRGTWSLDGGGALINEGMHTVDLLLWICGNVTPVNAHTATALHRIEAEDLALALQEFENGALGVLQACDVRLSWLSPALGDQQHRGNCHRCRRSHRRR